MTQRPRPSPSRRPSIVPPIARLVARAAVIASLCCAGAWLAAAWPGAALAQRRATDARDRVRGALATADLRACGSRPEWAGRTARVAIVVRESGEWGLAITSVAPALTGRAHGELVQCLETAVHARLGDTLPVPPRAALVVTADLDVPGDARLATILGSRIATAGAAFQACVLERAAPRLTRIDVAARVEVRGGRVTEVAPRSHDDPDGQIAACIGTALGSATGLPDGATLFRTTVTRSSEPTSAVQPHDGTERAVCSWGERERSAARGRRLPDPSPCRAGLQCCYSGGIAGLSSTCIRVDERGCPMYP